MGVFLPIFLTHLKWVKIIFLFNFMETQNLELRIENALNPPSPNNLHRNKNKKTEQQQKIPEIEINENGEMLIYTLGDMKITKHTANNMYTLYSIHKLMSNIQYKTITSFLSTSRFQYMLQSYDSDFIKREFVYYIQFDNYVKIGQTFDITKRYQPRDIKNRVKRLVFVKCVNNCERNLIKNFNERYIPYRGREGFKIISQNDISESLRLFDSIVENYKLTTDDDLTKHVQHYKYDKIYGTGFYLSPLAASIVLNMYSDTDYTNCKTFIKTIETMDSKFDKSDYISTFDESGDTFFYWKFHGYTVIVNIDKNMINASRLWNTILKSQNKDKKDNPFTNFLKRPHIQEIFKNNPETRPIKLHYNKRPLLNGRYMPIVFAHFILDSLDAKYSYEVAKLMTESLFEKAKQKAIKNKKTSNSKTISGGDILEIKKIETIHNLFDILTKNRYRFGYIM